MALVKCEECKKDISDKAASCPHCGCPVVKKVECSECGHLLDPNDKICHECGCPVKLNIESAPEMKVEDFVLTKKEDSDKAKFKTGAKVWLIIGTIACFLMALFYLLSEPILDIRQGIVLVLHSDSNTVIYPLVFLATLLGLSYIWLLKNCNKISYFIMLGINALIALCALFTSYAIIMIFTLILVVINTVITSVVCLKQLNKRKNSTGDIIAFVIIAIVLFIGTFCGSSIVYNNYNDDVYSDGYQDEYLEPEVQLTPKEKMSDKWTRIHGAACTDEKCMYLFQAAGTQTYYTLDYKKGIYESDFFSSAGENYYKYDYRKDTGYAKMIVIAGYLSSKVEVNITFDKVKNEYRYKWTCDLDDCKSIAEGMAESVDKMRTELLEDCDELGISVNDLK